MSREYTNKLEPKEILAAVGAETLRVTGEYPSKSIAAALIGESVFFSVTPLPDDEWEFTSRPGEFNALVACATTVAARVLQEQIALTEEIVSELIAEEKAENEAARRFLAVVASTEEAAIASMSPGEAWAGFVGADDPRTYSDEGVARYVNESPFCADLDESAKIALREKLMAHKLSAST